MADVAASLKDWSTTASSNSPSDSTIIGAGLADNLQQIQATVRTSLAHKGADIPSASTTDLGAVAGLFNDITGATPITGLGTVSAGIWKVIKFEGALTLTHNATSLILPGAKNITTAIGDVGIFVSEGSGNWRCVAFTQASGASLNATPPGAIMDFAGSTAPFGWLECDGSAISRTTYASLFSAISTTWGLGDGSLTFNIPDFRNKHRIGKGTGTVVATGDTDDVDLTGNTLAVDANNTKWITGMGVVFTLDSGTITGLTSGNTYYIIRNSSTTIKLATSLANAQNGSAQDFSAKSSPVWSITHTYTARVLGEYGGEETHALSSTEDLAHTHTADNVTNTGEGDSIPAGAVAVGLLVGTENTSSFGGNAAMNNMSPFGAVMTIIKY